MKTGIQLIAEERVRQITEEGFTAEHDDQHINGELADAGAYYALSDDITEFMDKEWGEDNHLHIFPFDLEWLKIDNDRVKSLTKAGALIAAEIDRLLRIQNP